MNWGEKNLQVFGVSEKMYKKKKFFFFPFLFSGSFGKNEFLLKKKFNQKKIFHFNQKEREKEIFFSSGGRGRGRSGGGSGSW